MIDKLFPTFVFATVDVKCRVAAVKCLPIRSVQIIYLGTLGHGFHTVVRILKRTNINTTINAIMREIRIGNSSS